MKAVDGSKVATWSEFYNEMTASKFQVTCISEQEMYEDIGSMTYIMWLGACPENPKRHVVLLAFGKAEDKFWEKFTPGVTYVVQNAVLVHEWGIGGILDDFDAEMFALLTTKSKVAKPTKKNSEGLVSLDLLVQKALKPVFRSTIVSHTMVDRDWDPEQPSFIVRMRNMENGKMVNSDIYCEGLELCDTAFPCIELDHDYVFSGGELKMEYDMRSYHFCLNAPDSTLTKIGPSELIPAA